MQIGLVILNYKTKEITEKLVIKCCAFSIFSSIVVVDNNSGDDFSNIERIENVKVIYNNVNSGYANGNNIGFKFQYEQCKCDIAFLANPDVEFEVDTIEKIARFILSNDSYCIVSSKRSDSTYGPYVLQFWDRPKFFECLLESFYLFRRYNYKKRRISSFKKIEECDDITHLDVEVVPGAFFGVNLMHFSELNYLDENTFLWFEENCLSYRCIEHNYKQCLLLNCSYMHNHITHARGNRLFYQYNRSKEHYCREYLKLNKFKMFLIRIFDVYSNIEQRVLNLIAKLIK